MTNLIQELKDNLARGLYGITKAQAIADNICINCKQLPVFHSEAGKKEYFISGLCEPCFDNICKEKE